MEESFCSAPEAARLVPVAKSRDDLRQAADPQRAQMFHSCAHTDEAAQRRERL